MNILTRLVFSKRDKFGRTVLILLYKPYFISPDYNRSLNNYVETILMDVAYNTPNTTTLAAMKEAQDESTLTTVNMDSYDSFLSSLGVK